MNEAMLLSAIESVLFIHGEPVSRSKIAKAIGTSEKDVAYGLTQLKNRYRDLQSGFSIVEYEQEVEMTTNPENAPHIERLLAVERESSLGKATMETLSIIAYRGPIAKSHIEAIRGVNCSFSIRTLLLRGLIDRRANPDRIREYKYYPSFKFLEFLGITRIEDLPNYESLSRDSRLTALTDDLREVEEGSDFSKEK